MTVEQAENVKAAPAGQWFPRHRVVDAGAHATLRDEVRRQAQRIAKLEFELTALTTNPNNEAAVLFSEQGERIAELEAEVARLRQRQQWIDEVGRPEHPDDERPWAAAYLDAKQQLEEWAEIVGMQEAQICSFEERIVQGGQG